MSAIAPTLQAFFTERLIKHRCASPKTIDSYRDTLRLLLCFARDRLRAVCRRPVGGAGPAADGLYRALGTLARRPIRPVGEQVAR